MDEFGWLEGTLAPDARRAAITGFPLPARAEAWDLDINSSFQNTEEWGHLPDDLSYSMPFRIFDASHNGASQHLNDFFAAAPALNTTDILPNTTNESSICQAGWGLMSAVVKPSFQFIEACTVESQLSQAPSQENLDQGFRDAFEAASHSYRCIFCGVAHPSMYEHRRHLKVHGYSCHQCGKTFSCQEDLGYHARGTGHEAYLCCDCDATFSRVDVLKRHKIQHSPPQKKFSCSHCNKWKAPNGFARKDHLTQHLRDCHHIDERVDSSRPSHAVYTDSDFYACCVHEGCPLFRYEDDWKGDLLFKSRGVFTKRMREEHDETPFPCTKTGCKRVNGKGFFRKRGLIKHMKREHDISFEDDVEIVEDTAREGTSTSHGNPWWKINRDQYGMII